MISGFVIYWSLSRSPSVQSFAWSRFSRLSSVYWAALIIIFGCYCVFAVVITSVAIVLTRPILVYFATISYALYLIHQNIGYVMMNYSYQLKSPYLGIFFSFFLSLLLAHLLPSSKDQAFVILGIFGKTVQRILRMKLLNKNFCVGLFCG